MDTKFKWNMFITSFIPLWIAIIVSDLWDIISYIICWEWQNGSKMQSNNFFVCFCMDNMLLLITISIVLTVVADSIIELSMFIRRKERETSKPKGHLIKTERSNKVSAEFLLAYILPMIAFDFSNVKSVALFCLYFLILAYLCIRNNNVYTNIYLELKKYRMYKCDVECYIANGKKIYQNSLVISKRDLISKVNPDFSYWDFDNYIFIDLEEG